RLEIETALGNGIEILPILVDGARMPEKANLPDSLKDFHFLNAARIDAGQDFRSQIDSLIGHIDQCTGPDHGTSAPARSPTTEVPSRPELAGRTSQARERSAQRALRLISSLRPDAGAPGSVPAAHSPAVRAPTNDGKSWGAIKDLSLARLSRAVA